MKKTPPKQATGASPDPLSDAQILGADPLQPGDYLEKPVIDIKLPYHEIAARLASVIPHGSLYLLDNEPVTIIPAPKQFKAIITPMDQSRFATWISQYARFKSMDKNGNTRETSLSEAMARVILASDVFREALPEVREICPVRLPLLRKKGNKASFEPAPIGYDAENKLYTVDSLPINWEKTYPIEVVRKTFIKIFSEFALDGGLIGGPTGAEEVQPLLSPSLAACITAMVGQFLRHAIDRFPMIIFNANKKGTGKTFLARVCLAPIWGDVPVANYTNDENELRKTLNSLLFNSEAICMLDDVNTLNNNTLNRYITASKIKDRQFHTNKIFEKQNRMQFFATGNGLKSSEDIERRSIPVDLFFARDIRTRKFKYTVSDAIIASPTWRADMMAGLWSLVKHWERSNFPQFLPREALPSFEKYTQVAINPVMCAGFCSPLGKRIVNLDTGDAMGHALEEVLIAIADTIIPEYQKQDTGLFTVYTVPELIELARKLNKLDIVTNHAEYPNRIFGQAMRKIKGNEYQDSRGRWFTVGDKRTSASTVYRFTILTERTHELDTTVSPLTTGDAPPDPFA